MLIYTCGVLKQERFSIVEIGHVEQEGLRVGIGDRDCGFPAHLVRSAR